MSDLPQISEAEFEVMKIVWKYAPISTNDITDKLLQTTSWSPKTIQTLIKRLVNILFWSKCTVSARFQTVQRIRSLERYRVKRF